ncbi:hypothetical protein DPMN_094793 [Dreissena polymorpha]|uniref:Integrase p58-like C-terminal domain-containing protein n=1 Tax=Dreissena polymorpha TaxID=45954 RepID=A0A9D4L5C6_DREPO|nr:hypothetical protein DPMN_094793 [Dreissena polymorpha]
MEVVSSTCESKTRVRMDGSYIVLERITGLTYKVQKDSDSPILVLHVDQLKPYEEPMPPKICNKKTPIVNENFQGEPYKPWSRRERVI